MGPITVTRTKRGPDVVMTATRYPLSSNNIIIAVVSPSSLNPAGSSLLLVSFLSLSSLSAPDMNRRGENCSTVLLRGRIHQANLNMDFILSYRRFVQLFCPLLPPPVALLSLRPLSPRHLLCMRVSPLLSSAMCALFLSIWSNFFVYILMLVFLSKQSFSWQNCDKKAVRCVFL